MTDKEGKTYEDERNQTARRYIKTFSKNARGDDERERFVAIFTLNKKKIGIGRTKKEAIENLRSLYPSVLIREKQTWLTRLIGFLKRI
ncbi:hypothetical protein IMZ31_23350 (plasmid) [Pontibacillus sp. ALD_SL1]|uniref:hypothetical protein n=1 Tax=Pontibacillus sp. ALD_SL1 TaxID=2777185 RepID=UPI001A95DB2B|nr:hypothetical protein [Pontibacillus sp. ALD_SL1]QST02389.1 hypothetical protein IMZ31_23350 [Pontibacillus sp. ALD_SL1]